MSEADAKRRETENLAREILASDPDNTDALSALGLAARHDRRWQEAVDCFARVVSLDPGRGDAAKGLVDALDAWARALADDGHYDAAAERLTRAIEVGGAPGLLHGHLAVVRHRQGEPDMALDAIEVALAAEPENAEHHDVQGLVLFALGREEKALAAFEHALDIDPGLATAHSNLGNARAERGDLAAAEGHLRRAVECRPEFAEAHFNLSRVLLMQGKFGEGWAENEWRWQCPDFPSTWREFPYPKWQGEPVAGKTVLVWSEQGIGDEIMFANAIPDLIAAGAELVLECNGRLAPVFQRSFPGALVVARSDPPDPAVAAAGIDFQTPLGSLCRVYRNAAESFPTEPGRYLAADAGRAEACRKRYQSLGPGLEVGISWRSGNPIVGHERSADLTLWDGILANLDCRFVNLQYGDVENELAAVKDRLGVEVYRDMNVNPLASAEDWFAQIAAMDMVISVDNSTIQVSGAQGVPTWCLLSYVPEWRFLMTGDGHLWHPSIRLYRQAVSGEWGGVFARAAQDLKDRAKT